MCVGDVGKSVGADLKRMVPDAIWLNGAALHRAQHAVTHTWVPVTDNSWAAALQVLTPVCRFTSYDSAWPYPMRLTPAHSKIVGGLHAFPMCFSHGYPKSCGDIMHIA